MGLHFWNCMGSGLCASCAFSPSLTRPPWLSLPASTTEFQTDPPPQVHPISSPTIQPPACQGSPLSLSTRWPNKSAFFSPSLPSSSFISPSQGLALHPTSGPSQESWTHFCVQPLKCTAPSIPFQLIIQKNSIIPLCKWLLNLSPFLTSCYCCFSLNFSLLEKQSQK